jgi:shikimate dehydrogenase
MFNHLSGATRLFPIIGDPIKYVESPMRLTRTFGERAHDGICVPMQVPADDLDTVMAGLTVSRNVDGILVTMPHKFTAFAHCATIPSLPAYLCGIGPGQVLTRPHRDHVATPAASVPP